MATSDKLGDGAAPLLGPSEQAGPERSSRVRWSPHDATGPADAGAALGEPGAAATVRRAVGPTAPA